MSPPSRLRCARAPASVILAALIGALPAAQPLRAQTFGDYRREVFTTEHGLPSQAIDDVVKTADGFLWSSAGGILVRFDGVSFRSFSRRDAPVLQRRVTRLHAGIGDTLWILDQGYAVIAYAAGRFTQVLPPRASRLRAVGQDGTGRLFGLGESRAWRLGRDGQPDLEVQPAIIVSDESLNRLERDRAGHLWVLDSAGSARRLEGPDSSARPTMSDRLVVSRARGEVLSVRARQSMRDVVRASGEVVATFDAARGARATLADASGRVWVSSGRSYEVHEAGRRDAVGSIPMQEPGTFGRMLEGEFGCVWSAELSLLRICRAPFRTIPVVLTRHPSLSRGHEGTVLAWDSVGRVVAVHADGSTRALAPSHEALRWAHVFVDRQGRAWWSPTELALSRLARDVRERGSWPGADAVRLLPHADATEMVQPPRADGEIWYAAANQVFRATLPATGRSRVTDSVATGGRATALAIAGDGTLWIAVNRSDLTPALLHVGSGRVDTIATREGLPADPVRALLADRDGTLWLGTYGGGLVRYRDGQFRSVTSADGLGEDVVTSVLDDGLGSLWMGGNRSVHRVARRDVQAFLDGAAPRVTGVTYDRRDGLTTPETSGRSGVRDDAGRLWFPTLGGAAVVDPVLAVGLDSEPPRVHVLAVRTAHDSSEARAGLVSLTRGARRVRVTYTGIADRKPEAMRFEYRLDDGRDWVDAAFAREVTLDNMAPGMHTFRVRAINAGGVRSIGETSVRFEVPAYFHETPAFYVLVLLALAALAVAAMRYRERELRHRQGQLTRAVDERTASLATALDTVQRQSQALQSLDEAKSRFFANVSHEFRTPLSLIIGPVEDLRDGRWGPLPVAAHSRLDGVLGNARRLLQLVEQLLDVARLESGSLHVKAEVRDLVPLLRRLADSFSSLAERRGILFRLSCPVGGMRVRYDPDQMQKIVGNLLGNALKFTPPGGEVELRATVEVEGDGAAVIEVRDTGPGIAPEHHGRVFERFFQVDDSTSRAHEGTGIGLALVRELVELHGGTVALRSALGEGSVFTVRLPLAAGAGHGPAESVGAPRAPRAPQAAASAPAAPETPPPLGDGPDDRTTVLVVEDNADLLEFLREHLAERYRVLVAASGRSALAMARMHVPDLIVSDVMMPEMDGHALCEAVKQDADIDFIPVILLTAKASRESRLVGLRGGADAYLTKPVDFDELFIRADNLIASRRRVQERYRALDRELPTIAVPVAAPPRDGSARALLDEFRGVLAAHLADEDFNVEAMAAAMKMGRSSLYRRLEPVLGKSPMDALWEYRLAQAARWLAETSITVSEVAYGVGFKSVPHFCGRFRDHFGETPSAYRRARQGVAASE